MVPRRPIHHFKPYRQLHFGFKELLKPDAFEEENLLLIQTGEGVTVWKKELQIHKLSVEAYKIDMQTVSSHLMSEQSEEQGSSLPSGG